MHTPVHIHTHVHTHTAHTQRIHTYIFTHSKYTYSYTHHTTVIHTMHTILYGFIHKYNIHSYTHSQSLSQTHTCTHTHACAHSHTHAHIHTDRKLGWALHKRKCKCKEKDEICPTQLDQRKVHWKHPGVPAHCKRVCHEWGCTMTENDNCNVVRDVEWTVKGAEQIKNLTGP